MIFIRHLINIILLCGGSGFKNKRIKWIETHGRRYTIRAEIEEILPGDDFTKEKYADSNFILFFFPKRYTIFPVDKILLLGHSCLQTEIL